jgi:hypothetical protein
LRENGSNLPTSCDFGGKEKIIDIKNIWIFLLTSSVKVIYGKCSIDKLSR